MLYIPAKLEMLPVAKTFTTSDLSRRSGDVIAEAMRAPVTLTQRNKPRLVLMTVEEFDFMRKASDHRRAYTLETIPDDLFEEIVKAVEDYANEPDDDA
jgi:prevent-host-death family protein